MLGEFGSDTRGRNKPVAFRKMEFRGQQRNEESIKHYLNCLGILASEGHNQEGKTSLLPHFIFSAQHGIFQD